MRLYILLTLLAILPVISIGAQMSDGSSDAKAIVEAARSLFPGKPVGIQGAITVRKNRGTVVKELEYRLKACWTETGGVLAGTLTDALGRQSGALDLSFIKGEAPEIKSPAGDFVDESGRIRGTALDCFDLLMPFLWWKDFKLAGREKSRGRDCHIVDFNSPSGTHVSRIRAWIDVSMFIVLKVENYSADNKRVKTVSVKSFKAIEDQWMIKDLEAAEDSANEKTIVTVEDMVIESSVEGQD